MNNEHKGNYGAPRETEWNVKPLGNAALNIVEVSEDDKLTITAWSDDSFLIKKHFLV